MSDIYLAAAVNDDLVLQNCLLRSPDIRDGSIEPIIKRGYRAAADAYNEVLDAVPEDAVVAFVHQDVYLPEGTLQRLSAAIDDLNDRDSRWAIAAVLGKDLEGQLVGRVWSTSWSKVFSGNQELPSKIVTADELFIVVRKASSIRFDPKLESFHLFATDIILTANAAGLKAYAIDCPVVHHEKVVKKLDRGYQSAYNFVAKKWRGQLPRPTMIVELRRSMFAVKMTDLRLRLFRIGADGSPPMSNPAEIAQRLDWE